MEMAKDDIQRATEMLKDVVSKLNKVMVMVPTRTGKVGGCQHDGVHGGITYADAFGQPPHGLGDTEASRDHMARM